MPKIIGKKQREIIGNMITKAEGYYCIACFAEGAGRRCPPKVKLVIDHANNDQTDWSPNNVHWVCKSHNLRFSRLSVEQHVLLMAGYSDVNERVRVVNSLSPHKAKILQELDLKTGSLEIRLNTIYENSWLEYIKKEIRDNGSILRKKAINAGAAIAKCSNSTTTRYYDVHSSDEGIFQERIDSAGRRMLVFRDIENANDKPVYSNGNGHKKQEIEKTTYKISEGESIK